MDDLIAALGLLKRYHAKTHKVRLQASTLATELLIYANLSDITKPRIENLGGK